MEMLHWVILNPIPSQMQFKGASVWSIAQSEQTRCEHTLNAEVSYRSLSVSRMSCGWYGFPTDSRSSLNQRSPFQDKFHHSFPVFLQHLQAKGIRAHGGG